MNPAALRILEAFDWLSLSRVSAADLVAAAGAGAGAALADLVDSGQLREINGEYERTEFGRLEIAGPLELTLLTRIGCHLCDLALRQVEPLAARLHMPLRLVDVDTDHVLRQDYGNEVPVLFLGSREIARYPFRLSEIRAAVKGARK